MWPSAVRISSALGHSPTCAVSTGIALPCPQPCENRVLGFAELSAVTRAAATPMHATQPYGLCNLIQSDADHTIYNGSAQFARGGCRSIVVRIDEIRRS